jgi:hypothetical protein
MGFDTETMSKVHTCGFKAFFQSVRSVQAAECLARAAQTILPWASPPQGPACIGVTARLKAAAGFQLSAPLVTQG